MLCLEVCRARTSEEYPNMFWSSGDFQEFAPIHVSPQHELPLFSLVAADVYVSGLGSW